MDFIKRMLGFENEESRPEKPDLRIATAAIFLEMATIDEEFDTAERDRIVGHLQNLHGLSEEQAQQLLRQVKAYLDRLATKRIIHKNKAANYKSELERHVNTLG